MAGMDFIRDLALVVAVAGVAGWLSQRIGLSVVVGYLLAGAVVGPYTPSFQLVADIEHVQMLSQLGLIFLIFSIGLTLSFQRLQRLGLSVALAAVIEAVALLFTCRLLGATMGWTPTQGLFLAGILMISSSAIVSKVLREQNATHQRPGQLALGVMVVEDIIAVLMLTLLSTLVQFGGEATSHLAQTAGALGAFVVALLLVTLLLVPRLLQVLTRSASAEVRTLLVIGLLLGLSWLAARAGYSMALGAFLLGVIVASTPQKPEIERTLEGLRDLFGAVFFVAIGMLVDFRILFAAWPLVLGLTALALLLRPLVAAFGLIVTGHAPRDSIRAGFALAPLGEFSFVIAQLGVTTGAVPREFYPMAVGASLLTALVAPLLMRHSEPLSGRIEAAIPAFARTGLAFFHAGLKRIERRQQRSLLWRLTSRRAAQTGLHVVLVSALLVASQPVYAHLRATVGDDWLFPRGLSVIFWSAFGLLLLAPLIAIWRNVQALAMIVAEAATGGLADHRGWQTWFATGLRSVASLLVIVWLLLLAPFGLSLAWTSAAVLVILVLGALLLQRRLIRWHSRLEIEVQTQFSAAMTQGGSSALAQALHDRQDDWQLHAEEFVLPDLAACAGQKIGVLALRKRFGCSIASIDRQGYMIRNPSADTALYPQDRLLLLGTADQIDAAARELGAASTDKVAQEIEELGLECVTVPLDSPRAGHTLAELDPIRQVGVQVAGIQRAGQRTLTPGGADRIEAGDELLVLGPPRQIREFRDWLGSGHPS
ncbi:MAG: cation:proton antiporter [Opitutaceae bacterium]|nr:cation:proton antiporter [Opitutaceae bacterium]